MQDVVSGKMQIWFKFQKLRYIYDGEEKKTFNGMEFPEHHSVKHYLEWKGYQEEEDLLDAERHYGKNE